jgi:hypothetical protein
VLLQPLLWTKVDLHAPRLMLAGRPTQCCWRRMLVMLQQRVTS